MKDRRLVYIITLAVILIGTGITLKNSRQSNIDLDKMSEYLLSSSIYSEMQQIDKSDISNRYPGIEEDEVVDARIYVSQDETTRQFVIVEAVDEDAADKMSGVFLGYGKDLMYEYEDADLEEYTRIKGLQIRIASNYVIFTISDQTGIGGGMVEEYLEEHYRGN